MMFFSQYKRICLDHFAPTFSKHKEKDCYCRLCLRNLNVYSNQELQPSGKTGAGDDALSDCLLFSVLYSTLRGAALRKSLHQMIQFLCY